MGRVLTAEECLRQAEDCRTLAASTSDADLRTEYLKLADNLSELAAILTAQSRIMRPAVVAKTDPVIEKSSRDSDLPN